MPAAKFLGRSLHVTPEDFAVPSVVLSAVFLPCAIALGILIDELQTTLSVAPVIVAILGDPNNLEPAKMLRSRGQLYWVSGWVLVACFAALSCINIAIVVASCRGALLEKSKRAMVVPLVTIGMVLSVFMMPPLIIMTYGLDQGAEGLLGPTDPQLVEQLQALMDELGYVHKMEVICILVWVVMIGTPLLVLGVLSLFGDFRLLVRSCLVNLSVCLGCTDVLKSTEGSDTTIQAEVDNILRRLFGPLPLIGTDFSAAFFLLSRLQELNRKEAVLGARPPQNVTNEEMKRNLQDMMTPPDFPSEFVEDVAQPVESPLNGSERVDLTTIEEGQHYITWAEMAFGFVRVLNARKERARLSSKEQEESQTYMSYLHSLRRMFFDLENWELTKPSLEKPKEALKGILGDNEVSTRKQLISDSLEIPLDDVLDVRLDNQALGCVPYFIALDAKKKSIVVSIRGSQSLNDCLTDVVTTAAPISLVRGGFGLFDDFYEPHQGMTEPTIDNEKALKLAQLQQRSPSSIPWEELQLQDGYGHRGMIVSASKIYQDIRERGVLGQAAGGRLPERPELQEWRVLVTGHSLGGGLASLLTWALLPDLSGRIFCWAFEPPGGLVSIPVAERLESCVYSVVHGKDLVPRMTWRNIDSLSGQLMEAVARSKVNKNKLTFSRWLNNTSYTGRPESLFHAQVPSAGEVAVEMKRYHLKSKELKLEFGINKTIGYGLPGRIMYLRPLKASAKTEKGGRHCRLYDAVWLTRKQLAADGILISKNTLADHEFTRVDAALSISAERCRELQVRVGGESVGTHDREELASTSSWDEAGRAALDEPGSSDIEIDAKGSHEEGRV